MEARHDAVLTMYGEKAEEAEELRLDLEDVKAMYRNQVSQQMCDPTLCYNEVDNSTFKTDYRQFDF